MVTWFGTYRNDYFTSRGIYIRYDITWGVLMRWVRHCNDYISHIRFIAVNLRLIQYIGYRLINTIVRCIDCGRDRRRVKLYLILHHYFGSSFGRLGSLSFLFDLIFHLMYTCWCIGSYFYLTSSSIYANTCVATTCWDNLYDIGIKTCTSTELIIRKYIQRSSIILLHYFFRIGTFHWVCSEVICCGSGSIASCYSDRKGYFPCAGLRCYLIT